MQDDGFILGDPDNLELTDKILTLGWTPPEPKSEFDVLPVVIHLPGHRPKMFELPKEYVHEVEITHPKYPAFADLKLKWAAVPAISSFNLELGGVDYMCCPFNGWFMEQEVSRNLIERYNKVCPSPALQPYSRRLTTKGGAPPTPPGTPPKSCVTGYPLVAAGLGP